MVWERSDEGRSLRTFKAPHYFYVKDKEGKDVTMYGDRVTRIDFPNGAAFRAAKQDLQSDGIDMFESDIQPELKVLSENYYDVPAPNLHVTFFDIEVDYNTEVGFSSVANPYAPINSIALYHAYKNEYVVLAVPPDDSWTEDRLAKEVNDKVALPDDMNIDIRLFKTEKELLLYFLVEIEDSDLICGWNSDFFDVPYVGKRLEKIGKRYFRMMSFPEADIPKFREVERFGSVHETLDLSGRVSVDYLALFQKYEMEERHSYKLESISDEILSDLPKLEYSGTLARLYRDDFAYFVRYNIRDTEILHGFEDRLGYVELANQMCHLSTGQFKHVGGTLKLAELAMINYCHHKLGGLVVNDMHVPDDNGRIQGAFVLLPQVGLKENVSSVDIASLYPSSIRSINISKETIIGQFVNNVKAAEEIAKNSAAPLVFLFENGETSKLPACDWRTLLKEKKWAVSGYGTVFDQNKQGIIPKILEDWYAARKDLKKKMVQAKEAGDKIKAAYYDRMQYCYKIKLNSFYGALTNKHFRFFDLRMGESTTGTGRLILLHQCAKACEILDGEYAQPDRHEIEVDKKTGKEKDHFGFSEKYSVVYGDTDSTYFVTHADTPEQATIIGNRVSEIINDSFQEFMQDTFLCNPGFDNIIQCEREVVSDRGIFVDKKRYILHLTDLDGFPCDKIKVMGLDTKKTTMPKDVSAKLNGFIERFLKGEEWNVIAADIVKYKTELEEGSNVFAIGLPKGVKNVEEYTAGLKSTGASQRLPGHVAAAIHYNLALDKYGDKESMPIMSGMKIKVFYLTNPVGRFKSIALPVDIENVPSWFLEEYNVDRKAHIKRLVDKPLGNIIKAIGKDVPTKQALVVDSLLEF